MKAARPFLSPAIGVAIAGALALAAAGGPSRAHEGASGIVAERMEMMESLGDAMKRLASMYRGEAPYDPAAVRQAAVTIGRHGGEHMTRMFPPGSLDHSSEALPAIWQDWDRFTELADELAVHAESLSGSAEDGDITGAAAALPSRGDFARLGRVCSACHTEFRKED